MQSYHISPATGNPNICRAQAGNCPYGRVEEHYASKNEAREAYEKLQANPATATKRTPSVTHVVRERDIAVAEHALEKANRRLERGGRAERYTWTKEELLLPTGRFVRGTTEELLAPAVKLTVTTPGITYDDHRFVGLVERTEGAEPIIHSATGFTVDALPSGALTCDHCGKSIARQKTYIVEDKRGKRLQVGGSCVKNFLGGVKPEGLWALGFDPLKDTSLEFSEDTALSTQGGGMQLALPSEQVLAYGLAVTRGGRDYVSVARAQDTGARSTKELVNHAMWNEDSESEAIRAEAARYVENGEAARLLKKLRKSDASSEFGRNLGAAASGEVVREKHVGILLGGIAGVAAEKRKKAAARKVKAFPPATPGHTTYVGGSLAEHIVTVKEAKPVAGYDFQGNSITKTKLVMRDEEGHEVIWWASRPVEVAEGDKLSVTSGRVKAHNTYEGTDQTVATRLRMVDGKGNPV